MNEATLLSILGRIKRARNDMCEKCVDHSCSEAYCAPRNEYSVCGSGSRHIYLCRYQSYHVCLPDVCTHNSGTCPISGIDRGTPQSSYDSTDWRTWGNKVPQQYTTDHVRQSIADLVYRILYSPERKVIRDRYFEELHRKYRKQRKSYIDVCNGQHVPPDMIYIAILYDNYRPDNVRIVRNAPPVIQHNATQHAFYTAYLLKLWQIFRALLAEACAKPFIKLDPSHIVLAALYLMRRGYRCNDIDILPLDVFLREALPNINELPRLGINKKWITKGKEIISCALDYGFKMRLNRERLTVSMYELGSVDDEIVFTKCTSRKRTRQ